MSYEPTNWKDGDLVTSAKLNKIEQGIAASGGIRIVHLTMSGGIPSEGGSTPIVKAASTTGSGSVITNLAFQLDITPNELMDAFDNEEVVIIMVEGVEGAAQSLIGNFYYDGTTYTVYINHNFPPLTSSDPDEFFTYNPNSESSDDSGDSGNSGDDSGSSGGAR